MLNEGRDQKLDFGRRQVVAGRRVRLAQIAADDEGAEAAFGQEDCLGRAEAADYLHRSAGANALEEGAGRGGQEVRREQLWIGTAGVGLEVDPNRIHARGEHGLGGLDGLGCGALVGKEDVGEGEAGEVRLRTAEFVAHGADGLGRGRAGEGEEVDDVGAAGIDRAGLGGAAVHGLHVSEEDGLGEFLAEGGDDVGDAFGLEQGGAHFDKVDAGGEGGFGDREAKGNVGDVNGDLEGVLLFQLIEQAL